jgi:hypothetical protein
MINKSTKSSNRFKISYWSDYRINSKNYAREMEAMGKYFGGTMKVFAGV